MATREIYWNIQGIWVMYALFLVALTFFAYGVYAHYRLVLLGKPENRSDKLGTRIGTVLRQVLGHARVLRDWYSGPAHFLFFWAFVLLFLGTVVVFFQADLRLPIMHGAFYLVFQSLALDLAGLLGVVGLTLAIVRRYVLRPDRFMSPPRHRSLLDDGVVLGLFLAILITGFVIEGLRIEGTSDPWGAWSPVGNAVAGGLHALGVGRPLLLASHTFLWWFHLLLAFGFIAYVPYSKLRHLLLSPVAIFSRSLEPMGALSPIVLETANTLGAARPEDLTRKEIIDALACTECGRCQDVCPAYATEQPLSPKGVMLDLRDELYRSRSRLAPTGTGNLALALRRRAAPEDKEMPLISSVSPAALWSCVTCGNCMQECPVFIEQVPAIVDMRRYLVMEQSDFPPLMQEAVSSLEARGHPFRGTTASRTDWCEGLDVQLVGEDGPAEWLYWVGCVAAFDERSQRIARAFARLLQRAGVDFAILGDEERCNGDPARRIGNEYLFQTMVQGNLETLRRYGVRKIVTTCPHCFNTFKNEYPQFGGDFEVWHHTQFIDRLTAEGKLRPREIDRTIVMHDPCYLARYNGVVAEPRRILTSMGSEIREPRRSREETFCCGGGGGHLWFEEIEGTRINHERARQLTQTGASTVASACPFCMVMLSDGLKAAVGDTSPEVLDVAELMETATRA
ncbi:MAG TPA: heterodisulfide reductase-related iron-sulfur binding cluster [Chloroflexota bacterium]